jgi:hypothetical protein
MPVSRFTDLGGICALIAALTSSSAFAIDVSIPIVMPITGFMSVEGGAQRNGALMALDGRRPTSQFNPRSTTPALPRPAPPPRSIRR